MVKKGDLSEDEAAYMRYSAYARAEIVALCGGNASMLDDTSILAVWDRVKGQFATAETERANKAFAAAQRSYRVAKAEKARATAATQRADQAYAAAQYSDRIAKAEKAKAIASTNELEAIKRKGKIEIAGLRKEAEDTAKMHAHLLGRIAEFFLTVSVIAVMALAGWATAKAGFSTSIAITPE